MPFGDITTSLNYSYSNNIWQNDRDHLLAFTLNVPFSHWMRTDSQSAFRNSNASYSMSNDLKGGMTNLSGVYGTLLPDNNLNYSVQVGNTQGGNTSSGTSGTVIKAFHSVQDSRNVTVNLPDFPGSAEIPLSVYCSSEQKLSFYLSGATTDSARQVFANTAPDATKASGVGVSLMRNGKTLATGENVSLGTVNKSKVPLGLSATYGQTGNKVAAGAVQSVIGVTFIYE